MASNHCSKDQLVTLSLKSQIKQILEDLQDNDRLVPLRDQLLKTLMTALIGKFHQSHASTPQWRDTKMQVIMGCLMSLGSFLLPMFGLKIMASQDNHFVQKKNFQFADHFDWMHKQVTRK